MKYVLTMEFESPQELRSDFDLTTGCDLAQGVASALGLGEITVSYMALQPKGTPPLDKTIRVPFPRCTREKPL